MYYVVRQHRALPEYHATFLKLEDAQEYANSLKFTYGHSYDVRKLETVWNTDEEED